MLKKMKVGDIHFDLELIEIRPINSYVINQYRQTIRSGKSMGTLIVDKKSKCFISGNHRGTAYLEEFGPDHILEVEVINFKSRLEILEKFVEENIAHGQPMSGFTKKCVLRALQAEGMAPTEIANLFGVAVKRLEVWGKLNVIVIGDDGVERVKPAKRGMKSGTPMKQNQYNTHVKKDRGMSIFTQAEQITRWLEGNFINIECVRTMEALAALQKELNKFLKTKKAA